MRYLTCVLVCEGVSDRWVLPVLLQRATDQLCGEACLEAVEIAEIRCLSVDHQRPEMVVEAVGRERGSFDLLFYHHDGFPRRKAADKIEAVRRALVESGTDEPLVPVVPVKETEAWLIADPDALADVLSVPLSKVCELVPGRPDLIEDQDDPKRVLVEVLGSIVRRHRRTRPDGAEVERYFTALAESIDIDRLRKVPAFAAWRHAMENALQVLGYRRV
ncbi:DUF4276 family protein [Sphaerimonospora cavernae]|uniref:DUF4276 family protein n=1 Tax=Sphaerimonospora cavernae TaxID=1740611 RepID=A0ABV6U231_9ACTN